MRHCRPSNFAAFEKHGKVKVPNAALAKVNHFFERRDYHIKMQKAKQVGNDAEAKAMGEAEDAAAAAEEAAEDAYDAACESGVDIPEDTALLDRVSGGGNGVLLPI
jgi:hypothetical protein